MLKEDILLDNEPIEFKGGSLSLNDEDGYDSDQKSSATGINKVENKCALILPWAGEDPKSFFCYRDELVTNVFNEIKQFLLETYNLQDLNGIWLLTEISFWDNERERIVVITRNYLIIIKYDFIALKLLNHFRIPLHDIDTLIIGDLVYPTGSLAPYIDGITSGVMHILKNCALKVAPNNFINYSPQQNLSKIFNSTNFKARSRNVTGVRPMWNNGEPLKFSTKWNPFSSNIPWATLASHPLLWHKITDDDQLKIFDIDNFASRLVRAVQQASRTSFCRILHKPILLQNYFGVFSIIHNRNALGFFKIRGKFSF